ncbi:MAG: MBL fold metallo-hydrolase [Calditrichaeota bacterium]|nr:MAG: MBL fold metallo-hydrolase [Calditrichota bacterium]
MQSPPAGAYVAVLGVAQDGGYPQAGCTRQCCRPAWEGKVAPKHVSSLAVVDPQKQRRWLIDATPDFKAQLRMLDEMAPPQGTPDLQGIFLTHAHIGHYTGLMHLGREVIGAHHVPVYAMPRMKAFLEQNGPWDLLVRLENIRLYDLQNNIPVTLGQGLSITPFLVPHRDEYSETVGFLIAGPHRKVAYISDIDKWERWSTRIEDLLARVDLAFLDGTFYANGEVPGRDMSEIPHPFITESMHRFAGLPAREKNKIYFIHLNHTNPALQPQSEAYRTIREAGFHVAREGEKFGI